MNANARYANNLIAIRVGCNVSGIPNLLFVAAGYDKTHKPPWMIMRIAVEVIFVNTVQENCK